MIKTFTRIRYAIAAIFINSTPQNCQSQQFNSVNHTHSTRASIAHQTNHSKLLSALNLRTNQLLLSNSTNTALFQSQNTSTMSASHTSPQTPPIPTTSRVTFQSTLNSGVTSNRSSSEGPTSPIWELSKQEVFESKLTQLFTEGLLAVLTSKDAVLKEVRDCILQGDEHRCKDVNHFLHLYWRDLHVRSGCVCVDERVAILNSFRDNCLNFCTSHKQAVGV